MKKEELHFVCNVTNIFQMSDVSMFRLLLCFYFFIYVQTSQSSLACQLLGIESQDSKENFLFSFF